MFIINQDRDEIIQKTAPLITAPAIYDGKIYGINIYHDDHLLGTFDSVEEAIEEMSRIDRCEEEYCFVGGYFPGDDYELIEVLLNEMAD